MEKTLTEILSAHADYHSIFPLEVAALKQIQLDLSGSNEALTATENDTIRMCAYIKSCLGDNCIGWGGYGENRNWYARSENFFSNQELRTIHLGIDLWVAPGTPVLAPLAGRIHSFRNNSSLGDYGPTIIMQHQLAGRQFYTLYGHLSKDSLSGLTNGWKVSAGQTIGAIGSVSENGQWPPHLHFQIIEQIGNWSGDFPGVSTLADKDRFMAICPDPILILSKATLNQFRQTL